MTKYAQILTINMKLNKPKGKNDHQLIIDGQYNDIMTPEQVKMALELSFLFNHLTYQDEHFIF